MKFSAVILAGGQSSRMGRDKAWLLFRGRPLIVRQIELMRSAGAGEVLVSAPASPAYAALGCPVLADRFRRSGPLAGIERALDAARLPLVLMLPVDMPAMTAAFLRRLVNRSQEGRGVVPRVKGFIEPLVAVYPKSAHRIAARLLKEGHRAAVRLAEACVSERHADFFEVATRDAARFANWNTPKDVTSR
jgi:molybdopterin-guanine dinucleotide biosynthesis protein A